MAQFLVAPSRLSGRIVIPPSKSHTLRALVFAMMAKGKSTIWRYLPCDDTEAMIDAVRAFGASVDVFPDRLEVEGNHRAPQDVINVRNSGIVLRFMGALSALIPAYTVMTGADAIRSNRVVTPLMSALEQLGAFAVTTRPGGCAPIIIKGPMQAGKACLSGEDSQPVSALLIALSFLPGISHLTVSDPGEKPWIDLTLSWLKRFGARIEHTDYEHYVVHGGLMYNGFTCEIPGDFSSAAYPIAAALITGSEVIIENVDMSDVQGDKKLIEILIEMGAQIEIDNTTLIVKKTEKLIGKNLSINAYIDALPILAVIGCFAEGSMQLSDASIARKKESDRIYAITTELKKMGAKIEEREDGLFVSSSPLKGALLSSHADQRIAMALSVAALAAEGSSYIEGSEHAAKTYPTFAQDFCGLGAKIEVVE